MCLSGLINCEKLIALEEIRVLKVIKKDKSGLYSPVFNNEVWKVGVEKEVELKIIKYGFEYSNTLYRTTKGLYSYDITCDPKYCISVFSYFGGNSLEIYEAIISVGAEYIKIGSQYCSNKLKLIKKIC